MSQPTITYNNVTYTISTFSGSSNPDSLLTPWNGEMVTNTAPFANYYSQPGADLTIVFGTNIMPVGFFGPFGFVNTGGIYNGYAYDNTDGTTRYYTNVEFSGSSINFAKVLTVVPPAPAPAPAPYVPSATAIIEAKRVEVSDFSVTDYDLLSGYNAVSKTQIENIKSLLSGEIFSSENTLSSNINMLSGEIFSLDNILSGSLLSLNTDLLSLSGNLNTRIVNINSDISSLSGNLITLSGDLFSLSGVFTSSIKHLSGVVIQLGTDLNTKIIGLSGYIATLSSDINIEIDNLVTTFTNDRSVLIDSLSSYVTEKFNFLISNSTQETIDSINELLSNATGAVDSIHEINTLISNLKGEELTNLNNKISGLNYTLSNVQRDYFSKEGGTVTGDTTFTRNNQTVFKVDVTGNKVDATSLSISDTFYLNYKWRLKVGDDLTLKFQYSSGQFEDVNETTFKEIVFKAGTQ